MKQRSEPLFLMSISRRMLIYCLLITFVFMVNIAIMIWTSNNIEKVTNTIVSNDVETILKNSQISRDLSGVLAETHLLISTFYGHTDILGMKKEYLSRAIDNILKKEMEGNYKRSLQNFRVSLKRLLQQCSTINRRHTLIVESDKRINTLLSDLEEIVSTKIVELVLAGEDFRAFEQIGTLIPSYRESLLLATLNFTRISPTLKIEKDISSIIELLDNLHLRFRTLLASDTDVAQYGQKLLEEVGSYRQSISELQLERRELIQRLIVLDEVKEQSLIEMKALEDKSANAAQHMNNEISRLTDSSVKYVAILSGIVAVFLGVFTYFFLLWHIRRPMELIHRGIVSFSKGDLETRIQLGRHDEWSVIETALNRMAHDLSDSYNNLQKGNEELKEMYNEVEQNVQALEMEIHLREKVEEELQHSKKMEAIGILAGGVAHDLNNVLSGVVSYPDLLLLDMPEDSPYRKPISIIQESGKKAAAIVQDLLTLARRGVTVKDVVNMNDIVLEHLDSLDFKKMKSYHPRVDIEVDLVTGLWNIEGSAIHLMKTIMNLVSNAAESIHSKGKVLIQTENRVITKTEQIQNGPEPGEYAVLVVSDTGEGIPADNLERIFEPFYTKKEMGRSGTGLGLAVVWGTVQDHNGYIDVSTKEGEGTKFTLHFLKVDQESAAPSQVLSLRDYTGEGQSVLIIDDDRIQRKIASAMIDKLGYTIASVASGEDAVDYLKNHSVDLLILDMIMAPGIDGLETYKRILLDKPYQKAIITSGFSESISVKEAKEAGPAKYLKKPYTIEEIGLALKDAFKK